MSSTIFTTTSVDKKLTIVVGCEPEAQVENVLRSFPKLCGIATTEMRSWRRSVHLWLIDDGMLHDRLQNVLWRDVLFLFQSSSGNSSAIGSARAIVALNSKQVGTQ